MHPKTSRRARIPFAYVLAGVVVLLAGLIVLAPWLRPAPVPPTPTTVAAAPPPPTHPVPRPVDAERLPFSISFVSGSRAVQIPVGVQRADGTDRGSFDEILAAPSGGGILVALAQPATEPLRVSLPPGRELVAVYIGHEERVTAIQPLPGAAGATVAPYRLALVTARSTPHLDQIAAGDRSVLTSDLRQAVGVAEAPVVPVPVRGTVEAYPDPNAERSQPRLTQQPAYPVKG